MAELKEKEVKAVVYNTEITYGSYEGHPTIMLRKGGTWFSCGKSKANLITECSQAIKEFGERKE